MRREQTLHCGSVLRQTLLIGGKKLDQQSLARYRSVSGDAEEVVMLLNMTRSFMRGLLIQEQYGVTSATTADYVRKWIELIAPLMELKE